MFIFSMIAVLLHWVIPLLLIAVLFFVLRKKKKLFKFLCIVIVALTVFSYFSVGMYAKPTVSGTVTTSELPKFSTEHQTYFYKGFDGGDRINGCMYTYNKKDFNIDSCIDEFGKDISRLNKSIMKNERFISKETNGDVTIKYSPVVLSSHLDEFLLRDSYCGYIIIEQKNIVTFIKCEISAQGDSMFFSKIYSKNLKISIKDVLDSVISEKEYDEQLYYPT